jgi:putative adenylate-forming enzyme
MTPVFAALASYWTTRRLSRPGLSRELFEAAQQGALQRWLHRDLPQVAAFAMAPRQLGDLPVMDKAQLMADFARYNRAGISAEAVHAALGGDCQVAGYTVGASTGTSGNRGYFVISDAERFRWLGALLAKALEGMLWQAQRVAILLPQDTRLYGSARRVPHLQLQFFALGEGVERWREALQAFDPTVIVAPPKVLRYLVEAGFRLAPQRVFSAAETLDPVDRPIIEAGFGLGLRQIYMATEGLLGVSCAAGNLHLAEDSVYFEFEPVGEGLVSPLISSFRRQVQILARYRMNDLLRLSEARCACGSPLRVVSEVVGRVDDCFRVQDILVTPDILRNAVLRADARVHDFRVVQLGPQEIEITLPPELGLEVAEAVLGSVKAALTGLGVSPQIVLRRAALPVDFSRKLRRVECRLPQGRG